MNRNLEIGDVVISNDCSQHDLEAVALGFPKDEIPYTEHRIFLADQALKNYALSTVIEGKNLLTAEFLQAISL